MPRLERGVAGRRLYAAVIPAGEHFLTNTGEALWTQAYETMCIVTAKDSPPLTAAQKQAADEACVSFSWRMVVPSCPPRSDVIAYCPEGLPLGRSAGTKSWSLVYKSSITPDVEALALSRGSPYCPYMYDLGGREIVERPCIGSVTARVDGVMKSFNVRLGCGYKSDSTRSRYQIFGDSNEFSPYDRLILQVLKTGGHPDNNCEGRAVDS